MGTNNRITRISGKARIAAAVMAAVLILFVLFSVVFIAHEADHECTGDYDLYEEDGYQYCVLRNAVLE